MSSIKSFGPTKELGLKRGFDTTSMIIFGLVYVQQLRFTIT